jgi:predicted  nucleic acid-binding Zn-ribbon protein
MVVIQQDSNSVLLDIYSKFRVLESKNYTLGENLLTVNQNTIEEYRRFNSEISLIKGDIKELRDELFKLRETIKNFLGEIDYFAKKSDLKVLEKYINLWNPLKFVTEEELDDLISRKLKKRSLKKGDKSGNE